MADFQQQVNVRMAPGFAGDKASDNPRAYYPAGPGGLVAGPNGLTVARFAWVSPNLVDWDGGTLLANSSFNGIGSGSVAGFVPREQQGLNTTYLAASGLVIPKGFMVSLATSGDWWIKNEGTTMALPNQVCYAAYASGAASFANAGSPSTGGNGTTSSVAAGAGSVTGSISNSILTVTAVSSGTVQVGATISGTGIATGTQVVSQLTGTANGIGTYVVSPANQTVASTTVTCAHGVLTVGGTVTGTFAVGQLLSGSGVVAGTYITALGTGTGGAGTYIVSNATVVGSTSITGLSTIATKWFALTSAQPGDIVRCSAQALG